MNGSLRKLANGRWGYRFDLPPDPLTGRRRTRNRSGFATRKEAAVALRKAIRAQEDGRGVKASAKNVGEFLDEWHPTVRSSVRPTTWVNYRNYLDAYVLPVIGASRLQDLTAVRLNLLYGHLLESGRVRSPGGLAPKTVQNVHRMLHRALRDAVRWDLVPRNAAEDASPPRVARKKPSVWTPEQLRTFVNHVRGDRFFALWLLVVTTGLRRGELAGLTRQDVDLRRGRVSPTTPRVVVAGRPENSETKTRSGERSLALDPDTLDALRDYVITWEKERAAWAEHKSSLRVARRPTAAPRHTHQYVSQAPQGGRSARDPVARRAALLRHRGPPGRGVSQDHQ